MGNSAAALALLFVLERVFQILNVLLCGDFHYSPLVLLISVMLGHVLLTYTLYFLKTGNYNICIFEMQPVLMSWYQVVVSCLVSNCDTVL